MTSPRGRPTRFWILTSGFKRMRWRLLIIRLALLTASSECLKRTNLAFVTPSRSRHSKYFAAKLWSLSSGDYYLTPGKPSSYFIVEKYDVPSDGFPASSLAMLFEEADVKRLNMTTTNVTLPSAVAMLDSDRYPDMKSSLKAARDGSILIQRQHEVQKRRGRSGDRIYPNDILYRQEQLDIGASEYWHRSYNDACSLQSKRESKHPTFGEKVEESEEDLLLSRVIYEDDHIAIVNKPGGMNLFEHDAHATISSKKESKSYSSVKDLLPYAIKPPANGTRNVLAVPEPAHRLDKLTSGLLLVAKTRCALSNLSAQFRDRTVEKTYTAVCYNVPEATIIPNNDENYAGEGWQCITDPLDRKPAITFWRVLKRFEHEGAQLSLLELKPKTGRYRQLRRHMAKVKECPFVGDSVYAKGIENKDGVIGGVVGVPMARELGLFLCSSGVQFHHPYYKASDFNTGGVEAVQNATEADHQVTFVAEGDTVVMNAHIELPRKFYSIMV